MAFQFYVTIEGTRQGTFKGDPAAKDAPAAVSKTGGARSARISALAFNYGVTAPRDAATGQASGKRQHSPVSFVKEWDAASPQLFQACCTNEVLKSVLFEFVEADAQGNQQVSHSIQLTNATISSIRFDIQGPAPSAGGTAQDLEEIAMVFQKIEVVSISGGTAASDDWFVSAGSPPAITAGGSRVANIDGALPPQTKIRGAAQTPLASPALGVVAARGRLAGLKQPPQQARQDENVITQNIK
jgi:type VI secretion system secreted protein Hcp